MRLVLAALLIVAGCNAKPTDGSVATDDTETIADTDGGGGGGGNNGSTNGTTNGTTDSGGGGGGHHPKGYASSKVHGLAAKMQEEQCISCHGDDLKGGTTGVSCDSCHDQGWRTNCTFCHGDPADGTGSPPLHIDGQDDGANASYIPHRMHTTENGVKAAFDCTQCHVKPQNVLSPGHLFVGDTTPGKAETDFSQGLSAKAIWSSATGNCTNLYCHGNKGLNNGKVAHTATIGNNCHACHGDKSQIVSWATKLSGHHATHLGQGLGCAECHATTVDNNTHVKDVTLHVNGDADTSFPSGMNFNGTSCTGTCHGEGHSGRTW